MTRSLGARRQFGGAPAVVLIVLNYQHSADTLRCLRSVAASTFLNVYPVVVDNGSNDTEVELLRHGLHAGVELIETGENLGYAAGNNVAIRRAIDDRADYVWVLNPDTTVEPDTLSWMIGAAESDQSFGIVGSRVFHGGSTPLTIWYDGASVDRKRGAAVQHQHMGKRDEDVPALGPFRTGYVTGTSMLIRTEVFEDVGLLPEDYFLYFEETDFNLRVQDAGWNTVVEPRSRVHHFKRSTGRLPTPEYIYYYVRNRLIFGTRFSDTDVDTLVSDLDHFLTSWRDRVAERAPRWLAGFDELVSIALADGKSCRTGWRDLEEYRNPT